MISEDLFEPVFPLTAVLHFDNSGVAKHIYVSRRRWHFFLSVDSGGKSIAHERLSLILFIFSISLNSIGSGKGCLVASPSKDLSARLLRSISLIEAWSPPRTRHTLSADLRRCCAAVLPGNFQITSTRVFKSAAGVSCPRPLIRMRVVRDRLMAQSHP